MANVVARKLRKQPTDAERRLWLLLRGLKAEGYHFRRQVPIDAYIVDFACLSQRLVIEVDGSQHFSDSGRSSDSTRDAHLRWRGFSVLRFANVDVMRNATGVMERIVLEAGMLKHRD